jgi:hypothetical protein
MHQRTDLSVGLINGHDKLLVEVIAPPDTPAFVAVNWPAKPTVATPEAYPMVAAAITRLITECATALAQWKARRL